MKRTVLEAAVLAVAVLAAGIAGAAAQSYPSRPVTMIVPFPAGGPTDSLGAHRVGADEGLARSAGHRRERRRRRRLDRRQPRRARGARRLHHRHRPTDLVRLQQRRLQYELRPAEGFRAGGAAHDCAAVVDRPRRPAGQDVAGANRLAEGQWRQGVVRHDRHRQPVARVRDPVPENHRHAIPTRAVSRRRLRRCRIWSAGRSISRASKRPTRSPTCAPARSRRSRCSARRAGRRRPTCRPPTRRACRSPCRSGTGCGCRTAHRRTFLPRSTARSSTR